METSLVKQPPTEDGQHRSPESALGDYAVLIWRLPEVQLVYGTLEDGVLEAYVVGNSLGSEQYRAIFRLQEQIELHHPEFEWSFHVFDSKGTVSPIPLPREQRSYRFIRPNNS